MSNTLGRFQIVHGSPPCLPGKCVVCGSTHGRFVDFGFDIDFYGVVYFCDKCFTEGANSLGYLSPRQGQDLRDLVMHLEEQVAIESGKNVRLNDAVDSLSRLRISVPDNDSNQLVLDFDDSEDSGKSESVQPKVDRKPTGRKGRSVKQTDESGSSSLPNDASLNILTDSI